MNREYNIARFEQEMSKIQRPGLDKLMGYIRSSDFYKAPASTKYHLSVPGGLLQHSLNVLDALRDLLIKENDGQREDGTPKLKYHYAVAGRFVATVPEESVIIMALLHDLCKTYFYTEGFRWYKDDQNKWQKAPTFNVEDRMPLGHGDKSAFIIMKYMDLTNPELYAIWWHMGITDGGDPRQFGQAIEKFPIIYALHTADMIASHFMEADAGNKDGFTFEDLAGETGEGTMDAHLAAEEAEAPAAEEPPAPPEPEYQEAPPIESEA